MEIIIAIAVIWIGIAAESLIAVRARKRAQYQEQMQSRLAYYAVRQGSRGSR